MNGYDYAVNSGWPLWPKDPAIIGEKFLATLDALNRIDPSFANWEVNNLRQWTQFPLGQVIHDLTAFVVANMGVSDEGDPDPRYGYTVRGQNCHQLNSRSLSLRVKSGAYSENGAWVEAGSYMNPADPSIVTYPIFRAVLLALISIWPCDWANARAFKMDYWKASSAPGVRPHNQTRFHIPWISYLSEPLATGVKPPDDVLVEHLPDGGLLMIAAEGMLDPTDPIQMSRSKAIADILLERAGARSW